VFVVVIHQGKLDFQQLQKETTNMKGEKERVRKRCSLRGRGDCSSGRRDKAFLPKM
jgi:hypothetical protein